MRTIRTKFDRREMRRDRRYTSPPLAIRTADRDLTSVDWSLGGFRVTADMPVKVGGTIAGTLHLAGSDGFAFTATLVRRDEGTGALGFQFRQLTPLAFANLDRAPAGSLMARRPA